MKVIYNKPNDNNFKYKRWFDNNGTFDIWYKDVVYLYDYHNLNIPNELKIFLDKWNKKVLEYKKTFVEQYPVKLAREASYKYSDTILLEKLSKLDKYFDNIDINIFRSAQGVSLDTVISYKKEGKMYHFMDDYYTRKRNIETHYDED